MNHEFTIFYTDDDQDDIEFFREIINSFGNSYSLVTQNNGDQLLHALNNPPPHPHLLFLDINMPGLNGLEVLKKIRESRNPENLPIVMFSTSGDVNTINKSRELGANYYVQKSNVFDQLKRSIEHTLAINWGSFVPTENNFIYNH